MQLDAPSGSTDCCSSSSADPARRTRARARRETLEPSAKPLDVRAATGEELATEAHVKTGPADDVGHEGVAGDEAAAGQSNCEGADVETVARAGPSLGEVAFEDRFETPLAVALDGAGLVHERQAGGELAKQREQRQVRPCGRLEPMRLRLRDGDRPASDGRSQGWLELAEGNLPLRDSAQVVLIEVEEELHLRARTLPRGSCRSPIRSDRQPHRLQQGNAGPGDHGLARPRGSARGRPA